MKRLNILKLGLIWVILTGVSIVAQADTATVIPAQDCQIEALQVVCAATKTKTPQWVLDRQQYETTYVYAPPRLSSVAAPETPQWVLDRQQYETTFVYVPPRQPVVTMSGIQIP